MLRHRRVSARLINHYFSPSAVLGRGLFVGFKRLLVDRSALHAAKHLSIQIPVQGTVNEQPSIQKQRNNLQSYSNRLKRM
jgi:hypothetical protein